MHTDIDRYRFRLTHPSLLTCTGSSVDALPEWARPELCAISRHGNTQELPWSWLSMGLVIKGAGAAATRVPGV